MIKLNNFETHCSRITSEDKKRLRYKK